MPASDLPLLYPTTAEGSRDIVFESDPVNPDIVAHPAAALARPWEHVLLEGDIIFVPSTCPHYVRNLDDTVAISGNFIDQYASGWCHEECKWRPVGCEP